VRPLFVCSVGDFFDGKHFDALVFDLPLQLKFEKAHAEAMWPGAVGVIGRPRIVFENLPDQRYQLASPGFFGPASPEGLRRKFDLQGWPGPSGGKTSRSPGQSIGVGKIRFDIQNRGAVEEVDTAQVQDRTTFFRDDFFQFDRG